MVLFVVMSKNVVVHVKETSVLVFVVKDIRCCSCLGKQKLFFDVKEQAIFDIVFEKKLFVFLFLQKHWLYSSYCACCRR